MAHGAGCRTGVVTSAVYVCVVPRADARGSERRRGAVCVGSSGDGSVEGEGEVSGSAFFF